MIQWHSVSPYPDAAPVQERGKDGALIHGSNGRRNCFGRWIGAIQSAVGGTTYRFSAVCRPEGVRDASTNLHALITWLDAGGRPLQRDYIDRRETPDGILFSRTLPAPEGTASALAELCFKWSATGRVTWSDVEFSESPTLAPRTCRAASAFAEMPGGKEKNLQAMLRMIDRAAEAKPDILCLGEALLTVNVPILDNAVTLDGPEIVRIGEKAKAHHMYIVAGLILLEEGAYYNTAMLFGRGGGVEGIYRKIQLPLAEAECGFTPGNEFPVFNTDFGKVGMMICWDQGFPEIARRMAANGAEILLIPSAWNAVVQARSRASDNAVFVVTSTPRWNDAPCFIVDRFGEIVASCPGGEGHPSGYCVADLDLGKQYKTIWYSVGDCYGEHRAVKAAERRSDVL
jgi:predicted amidohydrolase